MAYYHLKAYLSFGEEANSITCLSLFTLYSYWYRPLKTRHTSRSLLMDIATIKGATIGVLLTCAAIRYPIGTNAYKTIVTMTIAQRDHTIADTISNAK